MAVVTYEVLTALTATNSVQRLESTKSKNKKIQKNSPDYVLPSAQVAVKKQGSSFSELRSVPKFYSTVEENKSKTSS